jgi:thymidylate kinase
LNATGAASEGAWGSSPTAIPIVYVVEGVAGSGKDTLCSQIVRSLQPEERRVLQFPEEAMLATWLYYFVEGIHELRLDLAERLVAYMHETLAQDPDAAFVLNRFHVSFAVWRAELRADAALEQRHQRLVESMRSLPLRILQTMLPEANADARASHVERRDRAWEAFLAQRVAFHSEASAGQSYLSQQGAMSAVLSRDGLPYRQVVVPLGEDVDVEGLWTAG